MKKGFSKSERESTESYLSVLLFIVKLVLSIQSKEINKWNRLHGSICMLEYEVDLSFSLSLNRVSVLFTKVIKFRDDLILIPNFSLCP